MEPCFVQQYDGMAVANFAAVQDGVTLYPDQVKVQVSMDSGRVVGAECSQYLASHTRRTDVTPAVTAAQAREMVSPKLTIKSERLCVIPLDAGEALCWGFSCTDGAADYWVFVNAKSGETEQLLRVSTLSTQNDVLYTQLGEVRSILLFHVVLSRRGTVGGNSSRAA